MRFGRLGPIGDETPVAFVDSTAYDLRPITRDIDGQFWSDGRWKEARTAIAQGTLPPLPNAAAQRVGAPIARPSAVICIGMNYAAHARESGGTAPEAPIMFLKPPNTVVGPDDPVQIPRNSRKTDWEVELGVVIGTPALYLDTESDAREHIAGFVLANDVSEREFQLEISGGQWSKGKSAPGFTPVGPWVVTPDEFDDRDARLRSSVNGEPRQDSSTRDLIFGVDHLIWSLSQYLRLEPGDLILTGTPEGVALSGRFPYLHDGDVVTLEIDGLGHQRQVFSSQRGPSLSTATSTEKEENNS